MKKQVLFIAVAILSFGIMQAQDIRFGAKAGVNFATIGGDFTDDAESKTGFHLGGLVELLLTDKIAIQPEVLYSAQGAKMEETESSDLVNLTITTTSKTKLDYINIPIMGKFYIIDGLAVEAGPQVSFLVSANRENEVEVSGDQDLIDLIDPSELESGEVDISDNISGIDFGVGIGASYRLGMGVFFGARYTLGLTNVNDFTGADNIKQQNNVFQLSAGYSF